MSDLQIYLYNALKGGFIFVIAFVINNKTNLLIIVHIFGIVIFHKPGNFQEHIK